jgi:Transcriptional regulator/sugar kinase
MTKSVKAMPSDLRVENRKSVLRTFENTEYRAIADINEITKISRQTIDKIIKYYIDKGVLIELKKGSSSEVGGKPPKLFSLSTAKRFLLIFIHHHEIQLRVTDLFYHETAVWKSPSQRITNMDYMWEQIETGIGEIVEDRACITGICMSVPLGTDVDDRLTVATPFPYWPASDYGRSLREPLEKIFPDCRNMYVLADGRVAGSGFMKEHQEVGKDDLLVSIYASSGIGGAIFENGVLKLGHNHLDGIIGHMIVDSHFSESCACGESGCLEQIVNRDRLHTRLELYRTDYESSALSGIPAHTVTFQDLFAASENGDPFCRKESAYYADMFAIALHNIQVCIDPTVIVFQGDFRFADSVFKNELINKLKVFIYTPKEFRVRIIYDDKDLDIRERIGGTYLLLSSYLNNPDKYI